MSATSSARSRCSTPPAIRQPGDAPSTGAHLLAAGSILHWATPESHVWGTGLDPAQPIGEIDGERIWALRGKLTYELLKPEISGLRDVPLGDPLYLVGRQRGGARAIARRSRIASASFRRSLIATHPAIAHLRARTASLCWTCATRSPVFLRPDDGVRGDRQFLA